MKINKGGVVSAANIADLDLSTNKTNNINAREISSKGGKTFQKLWKMVFWSLGN